MPKEGEDMAKCSKCNKNKKVPLKKTDWIWAEEVQNTLWNLFYQTED